MSYRRVAASPFTDAGMYFVDTAPRGKAIGILGLAVSIDVIHRLWMFFGGISVLTMTFR
jgi:hypothetical protein